MKKAGNSEKQIKKKSPGPVSTSSIYWTRENMDADLILLKLGIRVRRLRIGAGMTQRGLGEICGIDNSKITKIETGKINITLTTLYTICEALGITPHDFMDI